MTKPRHFLLPCTFQRCHCCQSLPTWKLFYRRSSCSNDKAVQSPSWHSCQSLPICRSYPKSPRIGFPRFRRKTYIWISLSTHLRCGLSATPVNKGSLDPPDRMKIFSFSKQGLTTTLFWKLSSISFRKIHQKYSEDNSLDQILPPLKIHPIWWIEACLKR